MANSLENDIDQLFTFSFIDDGNKDFIRDENDNVFKKKFFSYGDASEFIADGGLDDMGWTNRGTKIYCWEEEHDGVDVP